mmetsp:Transcript_70043/g.163912  ORF Transcript_70043/g.163912 Transcript_70043/m.163912 type:complete len:380 (-) Transcript_70043:21-1160(-)
MAKKERKIPTEEQITDEMELVWAPMGSYVPKTGQASIRWRRYVGARTVKDFYERGGLQIDLLFDLQRGYARPADTISYDHVFDNVDKAFLKHFKVHGYAVLRNALGAQRQKQFIDEFWKAMKAILPSRRRAKRESWKVPHGFKGIQVGYGLSQSDAAWTVRLAPRVLRAFAALFEVDASELVTSMDAFILSESIPKKSPEPWLHKDQRTEDKLLSVQGLYTAVEVTHNMAGTVLVPGSHRTKLPKEDKSLRVDENFAKSYLQSSKTRALMCKLIRPYVPAGGLLLFNSKLIHANDPGTVRRSEADGLPNRLALAVAYAPRKRRSEATRTRKIQAYFNGSTSNHWPCDRFSLKTFRRNNAVRGSRKLPEPPKDAKRLRLL